MEVGSGSFGTPLSVDACRDDAACIACPFSAGEKALYGYVLQRFGITHDAYGGGSAGLYGYHHGIVGKEAARTFPEKLEALA